MVICPICHAPLVQEKPCWHCENHHSFDVARQGYVNLLPVQQKHSLAPGDTKEMVAARRSFLDGGHYAPIAQTLSELVGSLAPETVLDVGCGEGYYLSHLKFVTKRWGIDISKEAVRFAAARDKSAQFLTATAAHLPFADSSFDCVLSMFAFTAEKEFARVLKPGGHFIQVLAGREHLMGLKNIIYPKIIEKEQHPEPNLDGFQLVSSKTVGFSFDLEKQQDVHDLLYMTPHVHRISAEGARALEETTVLSDHAQVIFHLYRVDKT